MATSIDSQAMMEALSLVLLDTRPYTDATFIHASIESEELEKGLLTVAADMIIQKQTGCIVINSLSSESKNEQKISYSGFTQWKEWLTTLGVEKILAIPEAIHTPEETDNLITLALKEKWKSITVIASPHHIMRCMSQMVFYLEKRNAMHLKVYTRTLDSIDWNLPATKMVLGGGEISGSLFDHIGSEHERLVKYADKNGVGYIPHATLEEVVSYMRTR